MKRPTTLFLWISVALFWGAVIACATNRPASGAVCILGAWVAGRIAVAWMAARITIALPNPQQQNQYALN